ASSPSAASISRTRAPHRNFRQASRCAFAVRGASLLEGGAMFDHIGIDVAQFDQSVRFYEAALAPLGFRLEANDPKTGTAGFGSPGAPAFWIARGNKATN